YHGLQVQASRRMTHGYQLAGSYTLAKSVDLRSTWHFGGTTANARQEGFSTDVLNIGLDRGRSIYDARHRFVLNFIWELPSQRTAAGARRVLLSGWQVAGIVALQSGQPFTPYHSGTFLSGGDFNADGEKNDRPNTPASGNTIPSERSSWANAGGGPFR